MNSHDTTSDQHYKFFKLGLLVTGKTEEEHIPKLFRTQMELDICSFEVIRKVEQLDVRTSQKNLRWLKLVNTFLIIRLTEWDSQREITY